MSRWAGRIRCSADERESLSRCRKVEGWTESAAAAVRVLLLEMVCRVACVWATAAAAGDMHTVVAADWTGCSMLASLFRPLSRCRSVEPSCAPCVDALPAGSWNRGGWVAVVGRGLGRRWVVGWDGVGFGGWSLVFGGGSVGSR